MDLNNVAVSFLPTTEFRRLINNRASLWSPFEQKIIIILLIFSYFLLEKGAKRTSVIYIYTELGYSLRI